MRLAESVLRPAEKARLRVTSGVVRTKGFIFPRACYNESPVKPLIPKSVRMVVLAAAYFAAGKLGQLLTNGHSSVSPIWPASGVALAALLVWGIEFWPAVLVGACVVNLTASLPDGASTGLRILQAIGIAGGNTLEAVMGAWLVHHFASGPNAFLRVNDVFRYTFLAGFLSTIVSATVGTLTLLACGFLGAQTYLTAWVTWWMGDMVGVALVGPLILLWRTRPKEPFDANRTLEALALLGAVLVISAINFSDIFTLGEKHYPLAFLFIPFLVWAALRFESRGAIAFVAIMAGLAINGTRHGYGGFAITDENSSLLMLQTYICVATLTALVLGAAVAERKAAEDRFRKLNLELEHHVQQRTAQLEGTNKELEAFCYSVSHDLRAPLRTIRGFSEVLLEQYRPQLDARGQDYLRRTCDAGLQMDKLIEDLLKLSRLGRSEVQHAEINLSAIAQQIAGDLAKTEPGRQVQVAISPHVVAYGDERLLRLVIDNLLRNAWKFTRKQPEARIEFGRSNGEGSPYFVRDNGVGFDMQYASKLFGVFQRLHSAAEFAGTGVGLAIVQRVINRHGGRVWADAKVNSGATFYFTLPSTKAAN
ncbi:MAG TPA: MASE1 domain-containing protein [Verrucomicrobiae bacterium]